jgi:hypothetical protein
MKDEDITITMKDLRVGMSIGGWDMEITITHNPSKCKLVFQQHGSYPESSYKLRQRALMALELMVEAYEARPAS